MFHLKSKAGNVHRLTKDARKRDELLRLGYTEVEDDVKGATPYVPKTKRSRKGGNDYPSVTVDAVTPPLTRGGKKKEVEV